MTGGRSHDPVTLATAPEHPGWPCWHRPCRLIPARAFAPLTMVIKPGGFRPGSQLWCFAGTRVDLVDETFFVETFLVRASSKRAKPLNVIL